MVQLIRSQVMIWGFALSAGAALAADHETGTRDKSDAAAVKRAPGPHERDADREALRKAVCLDLVNLMPRVDADLLAARKISVRNAKRNVGFVFAVCRELAPLTERVASSSALAALSPAEFKSIYTGYCSNDFSDYSLSASLGDYRNAPTPTEDDQRLQSFSTALSQVARADQFSAKERGSLERLTEALKHPELHSTLRTDELNDRAKRLRGPMEEVCDAKALQSDAQVSALRDHLERAGAATNSPKLQRAFTQIAQKLN